MKKSREFKFIDWKVLLSATNVALFAVVLAAQQPQTQASNGLLLPDDPLFPNQWYCLNPGGAGSLPDADLDAEEAWELSTGGVTPAGDTIVIAVIDRGLDRLHPDLAANLWVNRGEMPGDGIDNDDNGYVDDYRGWNVALQNDQISGTWVSHGTALSGIIGAIGNNQTGICGVNWRVKIMFVAIDGTIADVLSACEYVRQQRLLYQRTQGKKGAFVVALNCSWGLAFGQPADQPMWCAAYDSLGTAGILSVAATANQAVDVDVVGDLPTTCPSDYLVAVTSLNRLDEKAPNAAWGARHIDIGAYGQEVYTTAPANNYAAFSGTSYAAPQVTGAIGLLYATSCAELTALAWADPAAAALKAKTLLLGSGTPNASLQNISSTGSRLNLATLLNNYAAQCGSCQPPFALKSFPEDTYSVSLHWTKPIGNKSVLLKWRKTGQAVWQYVNKPPNPYRLTGLEPCGTYEFALSIQCASDSTRYWSPPQPFKTEACCQAPSKLWAKDNAATGVTLTWPPVYGAIGYQLRYRRDSSAWEWQTMDICTAQLSGLEICTRYEAQVRTLCDTGITVFSAPYWFQTSQCGACTDVKYCLPIVENAYSEWIHAIQIGTWRHEPGGNPMPYRDFTGTSTDILSLLPGDSLATIVTPGFANQSAKEFFRIFIDFNMDGDFDDVGELAFDPGYASENPIQGLLKVPNFQATGLTRMRVMMKYRTMTNTFPLPCEPYAFGQVQDFCVALKQTVPTNQGILLRAAHLNVYPIPAHASFTLVLPERIEAPCDLSVWNAGGGLVYRERIEGYRFPAPVISIATWLPGVYTLQARCGAQVFYGRVLKI